MHSINRRALSALLDSSSAISDPSVLPLLAACEVGGGGGGGGGMDVPLVVVVELEVDVGVGVAIPGVSPLALSPHSLFFFSVYLYSCLGMEDETSSRAGICIGEVGCSAISLPPNSDCIGLDAIEDCLLSSYSSSDSVGNTLGPFFGLCSGFLDFPPFLPLGGMV